MDDEKVCVADVPGRKIDSAANTARDRSGNDDQNRVVM
jgi:hypothetical protein